MSAISSASAGEVVNTDILVLTKPGEASFQTAKASVSTLWTIIAVLVAGAVAGFLGRLQSGDVGSMISGLIFGAIVVLIGYYIGQVILWIFAKLFGGQGDLMLQANLLATFSAPLTIVTAILGLIPVLGGLVNLLIGIYELVLLTFGLKVVHGYTTGKAVLTWLIPLIIVAIIGFILVVIGAVIFASILGGFGQ